jgi:hypothetical protein
VGSSPYGISITGATGGTFDPANYAITYAPGTLTVSKATLTVTPGAAKTYDGRGYAGGAVTYSGFVNSEGAADLGGTLAFGGAAQGATNAGTYALTASGQTSANYDIVYGGGNLVINPAPLTIAADNVTKTYGQTATLVAFTPTGLQNGETVGSATLASSGAAATAGVGSSPYGISITGATGGTFDPANYAITYAPGTLTVSKATLTVTALPASKVQDGAPYAGGAGVSYVGFVGGQGAGVLSGTLSYGGSAQGATAPGTYSLLPRGLSSLNYDITFLGDFLTITPGGDTVDPIPYLLPPVKPKPFLVLTQPIAPSAPVSLGVGGLNYVHVENSSQVGAAPVVAAGVAAPGAPETQPGDNGGPVDVTALPRSIKGPTDVFIIKGGLNIGEKVLLAE